MPALAHCRGFYEMFGMHRQKPLARVHRGSRGTCSDVQALKPAGVNPRFSNWNKILIIMRQTCLPVQKLTPVPFGQLLYFGHAERMLQ